MNKYEKMFIFDRFGRLSEPLVTQIDGMEWTLKFEYNEVGGITMIDAIYKCTNFGEYEGCYVIMQFNDRRASQFFKVNQSVYIVRKLFIAVPVHHPVVNGPERRLRRRTAYMEWIGEDGPIYHPLTFRPTLKMQTTHMPMNYCPQVTKLYTPQETYFSPRYGEIPYEFDPDIFINVSRHIKKLITDLKNKTETEMRDLKEVLGFFYHRWDNGITDDRILETKLLCHEFGLFSEVKREHMFSWNHRRARVTEDNNSPVAHTYAAVEYFFQEPIKVQYQNCLQINHEFYFNDSKVTIEIEIFKKIYNKKMFLSFGALFIMPFCKDVFECSIIVKSETAKINYSVSRLLKLGQNTLMIPTLFESPVLLPEIVECQIQMRLSKVDPKRPYEVIPRNYVFPGITNFMLKFEENFLRVDKNFIIQHMEYFAKYLTNVFFHGPTKTEVHFNKEEFNGMYHLLDALYHSSKAFTVESFKACGVAADAMRCNTMVEVWEKCARDSKHPEIQKLVFDQWRNDQDVPNSSED